MQTTAATDIAKPRNNGSASNEKSLQSGFPFSFHILITFNVDDGSIRTNNKKIALMENSSSNHVEKGHFSIMRYLFPVAVTKTWLARILRYG